MWQNLGLWMFMSILYPKIGGWWENERPTSSLWNEPTTENWWNPTLSWRTMRNSWNWDGTENSQIEETTETPTEGIVKINRV